MPAEPDYEAGNQVQCTSPPCEHFSKDALYTCEGFFTAMFAMMMNYHCSSCGEPITTLVVMAGKHPTCPNHFIKWPPPGAPSNKEEEIERSYENVFG